MRYPAEETAEKHTRALQQAARLFRERGFSGASISEIMTATGLTHGSFYNHFESKEDLLAEAFMHASEKTLAVVDAIEPTQEGKIAMYREYLSLGHRDNPGEGCIMAALSTDFRAQPRTRGVITNYIQALLERMTSRFPWSPKRDARKQAIRALVAMVGGVMLARVVDDQEFSDEILQVVLAGLEKTRAG